MLKRYHERMLEAKEKLGGKCCRCGSLNKLEIDHIDKTTKSFTLGGFWSCSKEKFLFELGKCQLLCQQCHEKKTLSESGKKSAKNTHGTLSSYRYCKCSLCKQAKNEYMAKWRKKQEIVNTENVNSKC